MKILVVTPTLGESAWLEETVASVAAAAGVTEHVLVAPPWAVPALSSKYPRLPLVLDPGGGMYSAINAGIRAAKAWDAFTYINDDDLLLPAFEQVVAAVSGNGPTGALVAYGGVRLIDARGQRLGAIPISPSPELLRALYAQRIEPVYQHGTVVTRAAYDAIGGFDASLRFCGDSEYLARAATTGVRFVRATTAEVAAFRLRAGQLTKNRDAMIAERARVDQKLALLAPQLTGAHRLARWRFRLANLPIYAERIAKHGFVSFDELLARAG